MLKTLKEDKQSKGASQRHSFLHLSLECDRPWAGGLRASLGGVDAISLGRGESRQVTRRQEGETTLLRIEIPDGRMSSEHARLERAPSGWTIEDLGSSNGTLVNGQPSSSAAVVDGSVLTLGRSFFVFREADLDGDAPPDLEAGEMAKRLPGLRTFNAKLARDFDNLLQVAASQLDILVLGQTGTGKELVARAIHAASRRSGDLVPVNCGALTDSLLESQLFGYQKGAFSGATEDKPGLVRSADQGTLFLDEIGDLPGASQAALLRVLQEREVTPVGATRAISVDTRVVAATHQPLAEMVERQEFRSDLLARIRGFVVRLPPLRERLEDLGTVLATLLSNSDKGASTRFSLDSGLLLFGYGWPNNIRELGKSLELASILCKDGCIKPEHLPEYLREAALWQERSEGADGQAAPSAALGKLTGEDLQRRDEIIALLREHQGNVSAVARAMDKARFQIQRWIKRFEIDTTNYS